MTGYFGCLDMTVQKVFTVFEIFRGSSFTKYYLNSPLQSRLSATCYATVYVREVSFSAEAEALAYTYLPLSSDCAPTLPLSLSLSLLPLDGEGVVLAASDQESSVLVVLESGQIRVTVSTGTDSISLSSQEQLELGIWHYIHVSLTSFPSQELQLFVNGILHHAIPLSLTSFSLDLPTSAPVGVADPTPVLFLGQVTQDFNRSSNLPSFTGCMRDLTIDLCPVSFQSRSLVDSYPPGVTYHSCPSAPRAVPELPVQPEPPQQRVCLEAEPVELRSTHGGFSRDTSLETSSVAGLFGRQAPSYTHRRAGHVVTVRSVSGATVKVEVVEEGRLALTLISDSGTTASSTTSPLPHDIFTPLTVSCSVVPPAILCNLTVAGLPLSVAAEASFTSSVFDPAIPISLGMTQDNLGNSVEGFEGCISDLAINGDMTGFQGVVTDIPCYNQTVPGLGFTGISRIKLSLPSPEEAGGDVRVALTVRPLLETGVVLVLTSPLAPQPVLIVGLVQGEVRASLADVHDSIANKNFTNNRVMTVTLYLFQLRVSRPSGEYLTLAEGLCDPTNEMVFELSVSYTAVQLSVALSGGAPANYPPPPSLTQFGELVLTIGNLPDTLPTEADVSLLLGSDMLPAAQPAGLVGCVLSHSVQSQPLNLASVTHANIVNGFCVDN
ncbi:hypothetical protein GBAR_LOCUS3831 [Geodia barretti]|uniref:Laminin G domain-containing protein n=1 Tax=Geodia barretti TaxID=519541 RepID=A0AA35W986_GEOBA|nr:hypothetical protein GBAR_LOCUS3831 [Geodia barretti]